MATESAVNGTYPPHPAYATVDQTQAAYNANNMSSQLSYQNPTASSTAAAAASTATQSTSNPANDIPKDEVGWYFVEQYYTTLSRSPEKLFLFYNKRSQFVSGNETEKVAVSVGTRAINDRIKELDFQDCKVRVTNVDSQASDDNIVIQVIGEISNKSAPHKKFTQTFVLAGQTNGYFVLNDIFRYIVEEEDDVVAEETQQDPAAATAPSGLQEPAPTAVPDAVKPETMTSSDDPSAVEHDATLVDKELEAKVNEEPAVVEQAAAEEPTTNGTTNGDEAAAEETPAAAEPASADAEETAAPEPAATETLEPEKPQDPTPTPALSPPKQAAAQPAAPAAPPKPAAPKTWASLAASAHRVATPAIPAPQSPASAAPAQSKAAPAPTPAPAVSSASTTSAPAREPSPVASQQDEWTSVGGDNKRQQSKAQASTGAQDNAQSRAYIKNVNESIEAKDLRSALEKFGEIVYFDISRQKNCAFVDFKSPEAYKAAVEANPHQIGNERVVVEERRLKPGSYPYVPRGGSMRGGSRGGPNQGTGRGSFQGGRGGFPQRGRGGNTGRGRGGAQAA